MRIAKFRFSLVVVAVEIACIAAAQSIAQTLPCARPQAMRAGWDASFVADCTDRNGKFVGGSQIIHLVTHKGQIYAASGFWMDSHNIWYGGKDPKAGWSQVLRLSGPKEAWTVDLDLGPQHLRTELLKSVTFTLDAQGRPLPAPETLLIAATYVGAGRGGVDVFVRNDETGSWTKTKLISGNTGKSGEDNSVRAAAVYRDRVTGREQLFISVGVLGLFAGQYAPWQPGRIKWAERPEFGPTSGTRILAVIEANDSLFLSDGTKVYRRVDGPKPSYLEVADMSDEVSPGVSRQSLSAVGGIRALTAIPGPVQGKQSLIFMWAPGGKSRGCITRLDPWPDGSYARAHEACLANLVRRYLGMPISFTAGAYNTFMPLRDPRSNELLHIIGLESFIPGRSLVHLTAHNQRNAQGGMYAGSMYALRDAQGRWRIGEVNGKYQPGLPELVSVYTYALSPFGEADPQTIYLGGYDPDKYPSTSTAWVYRMDVMNLIGK